MELPADHIYNTAVLMYGKKERKNTDWFEESVSTLVPIIDAKRDVLIMYKSNPRQQNHQALKAARSLAQKTARRCANNYWLRLSSSIQMASWSGNIRVMYEGIKQATGKANEEVGTYQVQDWRCHQRQGQTDESVGRALP